jgi:23S rRNA (cytidine1920-2'-O)/16S rRNA (cytidine1409-2'-O)-methyltransferase
VSRVRADTLLTRRGLFETRSRAAAAILAGEVRLMPGGTRVEKAGQLVAEDAELEIVSAPQYVSRGGIKLANALDALGLSPAGARALDVGASTGGFTDCLLQRGAAHVVALDVAYGELAWRLRGEPRVTVLERVNARSLSAGLLPYAPELIVVDVSFISLHLVLPAVLACAAERFDCLAMVKPQFEVGRDRLGKGGVVREPAWRAEAVAGIARAAPRLRAGVGGFASSGLPGPKGNRETFVWLHEQARGGLSPQEIDPALSAAGV